MAGVTQVIEGVPFTSMKCPKKQIWVIVKKKSHGVKHKAVNLQLLLKDLDLSWTAVKVTSVLTRIVQISHILE